MTIALIIEKTLKEISFFEASGISDAADLSAARIACEAARKACSGLVLPAATDDALRRAHEARTVWNKSRQAVMKALRGGNDDDRLRRRAIGGMWYAVSTELLIKANEKKLSEIDGSVFPRLRVFK